MSLDPVDIGNPVFYLSSWRYWNTKSSIFSAIVEILFRPTPNPKPNSYPFLDPGRVNPGNAGGPRHKPSLVHGATRGSESRNPNPQGGCTARVFSRRYGVQRHMFMAICYHFSSSLILPRDCFSIECTLCLLSAVETVNKRHIAQVLT